MVWNLVGNYNTLHTQKLMVLGSIAFHGASVNITRDLLTIFTTVYNNLLRRYFLAKWLDCYGVC